MTASYEHTCPECGTTYCEDFDIDNEMDEKDIKCEECGEEYHVLAEIEVNVYIS
jgi:transcription elongation factor Elf1